ncbi:MAG: DHH family protein [bacterium ADurb.Bin157]|nr:MAG: DHH family protein [bacterium ADurb.Bin157]
MEAVILQQDFSKTQEHSLQWANLLSDNAGLQKIMAVIEQPSTALIFSHDDPDGITSGLIFKRTLEKKGWKVLHKMPEGFLLQPDQLNAALAEFPQAKAIFLLDKGTLPPYNDFAQKLPVYIIDHHPTAVVPDKCVSFNPAVPAYVQCSASILAHGIATLAQTRDEFDDLLCLIGLKGDWAIEPVTGFIADFVRPFFVNYGKNFKNLMTLVKERPTMFDASQRESTCLLSRISEYVHACGGGGFSYFYNDREESLANVNHPECVAKALEGISQKINEIKNIKSLDDFTALISEPQRTQLSKIWNYFLQDWESADTMLDSSAKILQLEDTSIYLFVGPKVPLLPMIGSIKLFDLKKNGNDKLAQIIMVSSVSSDYTHVSVRATGPRVHSGKFCTELQDSMQTRFPAQKTCISGGGHPVAAECTFKTKEVTFLNVLTRVTEVLSEMTSLDATAAKDKLTDTQKTRAAKLGLEYLN